jgi:hypothetical protein
LPPLDHAAPSLSGDSQSTFRPSKFPLSDHQIDAECNIPGNVLARVLVPQVRRNCAYVTLFVASGTANGEKLAASPYRARNLVERLVNRLKGYCRMATRYEKPSIHDLGTLTIASIVFWL